MPEEEPEDPFTLESPPNSPHRAPPISAERQREAARRRLLDDDEDDAIFEAEMTTGTCD